MASIQERLQLKRIPLDNWSLHEKLCLATAVACSGDQNWMSVSRTLKMICGKNRPSDWFSQKSCAAQYGRLLETVETPKRKKRLNEKDTVPVQTTVETPAQLILRSLNHERIVELRTLIEECTQRYNKERDDIIALKSDQLADEQLQQMYDEMMAEKGKAETERKVQEQWLKEREDRKLEMERTWRSTNPYQPQSPLKISMDLKPRDDQDGEDSRQGTSPLLTSLLKSPSPSQSPVSTTSLHSALQAPTRVSAPTITNLLTGTTSISKVMTAGPPTNFLPLQLTAPLTALSSMNTVPIVQSPSQAAPTLSMLLEKSQKETKSISYPIESIDPTAGQSSMSINQPEQFPVETEEVKVEPQSPIKDEDQQLMEVFNGLIPDNIDELANILTENNAIILNPELLEEDAMLENVDLMDDVDDIPESSLPEDIATEKTESIDLMNQQPSDHSNQPEDVSNTFLFQDDPGQHNIDPPMVDNKEPIDVKPEIDENKSEPIVINDDDPSDLSNDTPLAHLLPKPKSESFSDHQPDELSAGDQPTEPLDTFESDSNDDKCLESIKREIQSLSGLKENSDDNSNEEMPELVETVDEVTSVGLEVDGTKDIVAADLDEPIRIDNFVEEQPTENVPEPEYPEPSETVDKLESIEIVEIKDDKSDDETKEPSVIVIEETDDGNSEENALDDVKVVIPDEDPNEGVPECIPEDDEIEEVPDEIDQKHEDPTIEREEERFDRGEIIQEHESETAIDTKSIDDQPTMITIVDTDESSRDDVKSEDKPDRSNKRDYTRRRTEAVDVKKSTEQIEEKLTISHRLRLKDRDRSESPYIDDDEPTSKSRRYSTTPNIDSHPNSPASVSGDEREYRAWKKAIMMVYARLINHKYSPVFVKPITDDQVPGYRSIVYRPMDLPTIKRHVESGQITTTAQFQRDIFLMCTNAVMFNRDSTTHKMANEMMVEAIQSIEIIMDTWKRETSMSASASNSSANTSGPSKLSRSRKSHRIPANN